MLSACDIKASLEQAIADTAARHTDGKTFSRKRKLPLDIMLRFMIGAEGGSLAKELHRAGIDATPAAVSQRRAELAPVVFREVFTGFNAACVDSETYCGYRVLAVDGTTINLPYNPNAESFLHVETHPKGGYNALHATPLFDISSQTYVDCAIQPESKKDEIGALLEMLQKNNFIQKTLIVADRGFESYNLIAHLLEKPNTDFLIRVKQNHGAMREIARLPMLELDCDIAFTITTTQTNEDKQKRHIFLQIPKKSKEGAKTRRGRWDFPSPYPMRLRICRFQLDTGEFETIATSLPRSFSLEDIKEIYRLRWKIETSFNFLKHAVGLVNLHGRSDAFCEQEIYAALTMFNFASRISRQVVIRQPKDDMYAYKVNFKLAVALCREYFRTPGADGAELMRQIAKHAEAIRPGRHDTRKLKAKSYTAFVYRVAA